MCGREGTPEDRISQTGKCGDCARALLVSNIDQMRERSGPNFVRWRRAMAASVGGVLLDDVKADA